MRTDANNIAPNRICKPTQVRLFVIIRAAPSRAAQDRAAWGEEMKE